MFADKGTSVVQLRPDKNVLRRQYFTKMYYLPVDEPTGAAAGPNTTKEEKK
jgi:hypothetical protein